MLGDGRTVPIVEQELIAIDYLTANREALKGLAREPGVTTFILGLQYQIELEEGTIGFCLLPSTRLMSLASDIGIEPAYYVTIESRKETI